MRGKKLFSCFVMVLVLTVGGLLVANKEASKVSASGEKGTGTTKCEHTYVDYVCSECGDVDKAKFLEKFEINGTVYQVIDFRTNGKGTVVLDEQKDKTVSDITVPSTVQIKKATYRVKKIGKKAFKDCSKLKKVKVSRGIEVIDNYAFMSCTSLKSISMPSSLKYINKGAFKNCTELKRADIPRNVKGIDVEVFTSCVSLKKVDIGNDVTIIGRDAFSNCVNLQSVKIGKEVDYIDRGAFYNCNKLSDIKIKSKKLKRMGKYVFTGIPSDATITILESQQDSIVPLLTPETGYVETMLIKTSKFIF